MKKLFLLVLFLPLATLAQQILTVDLESLQQAAKKAGWVADDTWVRQHSAKDIKQILGAGGVSSTDIEFIAPVSEVRTEAVPAAVDWRNLNGVNYVSPILNQGNCGSCVAFAAVATLETQMNIAAFGSMLRFSPQALFSCGGGACQMGWWLGPAANYLKAKGVPDEACAPYISGATGQDVACSAVCGDVKNRSVRIANYSRPTTSIKNLAALKAALEKGPLFTSMMVYTDFLLYKSGIYKHVSGKQEGGHAVSIIGFDDAQRALIIRNSWGTDWGVNGFAYISYDDVSGIGNETWLFEAPKLDGYVTIHNPTNRMVVADNIQVETEATFPNLKTVTLSVIDGQKNILQSSNCALANCKFDLNTKTLQDGRYELVATASYNGITVESQHQYIYVINTIPQMTLSFKGKGVDLNAPVSGRIEFTINSDSGLAPLTNLKLLVKKDGAIVTTKETDSVLPVMSLGWRTINVPNGPYEIYLVGTMKINDRDYTVESNRFNITIRN